MTRSWQLGHRQQHSRGLESREAVASVRHDKQVTGPAIPGVLTGRQPDSSAQDVHGRLARVLVLGEDGAFEHGNNCLAQYPLMAADDGTGGMTPARGGGPFQQLMAESFQRKLLHACDTSNLPGGVTQPEEGASAALGISLIGLG